MLLLNHVFFASMLTCFLVVSVHSFQVQKTSFDSSPVPPTTRLSPSSTSTLFRGNQTPLKFNVKNDKKILRDGFISLRASSYVDTLSTSKIEGGEDNQADDKKSGGLGAWIPIASASSLSGLGPQRITTMGIDMVVWQNEKTGKWSASRDACSHRLAPLSQGRVDPDTGCIECPYHGWQFDDKGQVTKIPQMEPDKTINKNGNIENFSIHELGDLIFAFIPSKYHSESFPQSLLPEQMYPYIKDDASAGKTYFVRTLPYSFDFLVENFMDPAHIPFAHHKLQSVREDGSPIKMGVVENNHTMVEVSFEDISRGKPRDAIMSFQRPSFYHYREKKGEGEEYTPTLSILLAPVSAGKCRVFLRNLPIKLPQFLLHMGTNRFLNTDVWLHDGEREAIRRKDMLQNEENAKLAGLDYLYPTQSDLGTTTFRKWWLDFGMAHAPPHTFGPSTMDQLRQLPLSRREQIDPWENHSKHCSACRKALSWMKRGQKALLFTAIIGAIIGRNKPLLGLSLAALSLYGKNFLKKFATAIEGNPEISLIEDRSIAAITP